MLKFWKKIGNTKSHGAHQPTRESHCSLPNSPSTEEPNDNFDRRKYSRLSKPLVEIIKDSESLGYFIQYLEAMNVSALIKCLLDIKHFNVSIASSTRPVTWEEFNKMVRKPNGLEFCNSLIACDISSFSNERRGRVTVCAVSETKLTEMEQMEVEILAKAEEMDTSEATVDALKIFYKYFSYSAPYKIILSNEVFQKLIKSLRSVDKGTFAAVEEMLLMVLEKEYYLRYLRSDSHCKYQMSILTSSKLSISDFLYNESALFYLMEFLELEGCPGLVEFWMAANSFQQQFSMGNLTSEQAQEDAMVLYNKYFSLQATHPLNLGDKVRFLVEEAICREDGPLPSCFEPIQDSIVKMLQSQVLKPFLQSQIYFKYLSELISAVNAGPARPGGSDCSSDLSQPTSSPLTSESAEYVRTKPSMGIDSKSLEDPDSLWRRSTKAGLTLGRVNSLGRFQTDLEPGPDQKIGLDRRISKAMKKLVKIEEDSCKEELAWQVAEMIVKDVTSLTMPHHSDTL